MTITGTKQIYWDLSKNAIVNNSTGTTTEADPAPTVYLNNLYTFEYIIYTEWPTRWDLSSASEFREGFGTPGASDVLFESDNSDIDSTNANVGSIITSVNVSSVALTADLGTNEMQQYSAELQADTDSTIVLHDIFVNNTVYDS